MMKPGEHATNAWDRYEPSADAPWDLRRVVHLHRRAGLAASWGELQHDLANGPEASVTRLLAGKCRPAGAPEPDEFERTAAVLGEAATASSDSGRLKAWWFYRLIFTPDPLRERMTLMWHNHFATSVQKVNDPALMRKQNETCRRFACKPFGELLGAMTRDPALLIWLDAPANRKGHPNENLARELMELFTLGVGHYTESDVKETARALTGWTVTDGEFREAAARHDDGDKVILGKSGRWAGTDVVRILLEQPSTAHRLAWRLCDLFMGEGAVGKPEIAALADGLRANHLDIGWGVETVLRSRAFFDGSNIRTRVLGPVEFIVGAVRGLELLDPPPSTLVLADWCARLGQDLFNPPNVGGWPGGRSWLSARSLIGRANFAAALVDGRGVGRDAPLDPMALAGRCGRGRDRADAVRFCGEILSGTAPDDGQLERLGPSPGTSPKAWDGEAARGAAGRLIAAPESQLG
jgi:uncharacterized protein (DUF1800 family)